MSMKVAARTFVPALIFLGLWPFAFSSSTLNFPRISYDSQTFTGMAFVNPNNSKASITLSAYGTDGLLIHRTGFTNPVTLTVKPGQQIARVLADSDMFGDLPPEQIAWVQATSSQDGITGFFLFLNNSITILDGADLPKLGRKIVFHEVQEGNEASTEINIINPTTTPAELTLTLFRPEQAPVSPASPPTLAGRGVLRFSPMDLFNVESIPAGSYVVVNSPTNIGGFEFIRVPGQDLLGMNAVPATDVQQILYFPQMAVRGPWTTTLGLVNYSNESVIVTISAFTPDGALYAGSQLQGDNPKSVGLGPNGAMYQDVEDLFRFTGDETIAGWIKVEATSTSLNGFVSYGLKKSGSTGGSLAAVTSQSTALTHGLFSHVATASGYFTGVALLNPGQIANPYRVAAFRLDGTLVGTFDGVLRPGQRISQVIDEFVPGARGQLGGFILVRSTQPIYMTSLFGTSNGKVLANIPPQPSPAGFAPDSSQPSIKVNPPLAVVQPNATNQFSLTGPAGARTWKVNGVAGGDDSVGRITAAGLYTAPSDIPDPLPVTVSAEIARTGSTPLAGGATVDVLKKETLVAGTGQVLSVAYLQSLQRLYSAELAGTSVSAASSATPAAGSGSDIFLTWPKKQRHRLLQQPGVEIPKILPFQVATNPQDPNQIKEYLLLLDKTNGQVLRYDPTVPNSASNPTAVVTNLNSPNSMVFDPSSGDLLVAESQSISSFARSSLTADLASLRRSGPGSAVSKLIVDNLGGIARGISVDACTGRIFVSLGNGQILQIDRLTGERTQVQVPSLGLPGQMLGLYRREIPCPAAFQILVADPGTSRVALVDPSSSTPESLTWLSGLLPQDITYLPIGNAITGAAGVLLGEKKMQAAGGDVSLVQTPGLYTNKQANVGQPVLGDSYSDPVGDTFGTGDYQIDLTRVQIDRQSESPGFFVIELQFAEPVSLPGTTGAQNEVYGYIDFDTDQNESTGASSYVDYYSPYSPGLGVDYQLVLSDYTGQRFPLYRFESQTGTWSDTPVAYASVEGGGNTVMLFLDLYQGNTASDFNSFNFAVVVGTYQEPTDAAPNGGHLTSVSSAGY
ncbi:MAG: hypothetical protein P8020_12005 [Acidobacteriota bacterium]